MRVAEWIVDVLAAYRMAGVAHQNGTIRFGNDPATSALDPNCKAAARG